VGGGGWGLGVGGLGFGFQGLRHLAPRPRHLWDLCLGFGFRPGDQGSGPRVSAPPSIPPCKRVQGFGCGV